MIWPAGGGPVCFPCQNAAVFWNIEVLGVARNLHLPLCLQPVNERLRLLGGTAKLALDLLEYSASLERAFLTVCG